ncbi:recombinase family protein [Kitasatospora sp. NPDC001309]|uniref:recombinase family protein n=1 Tax=Kitasatospora sp. NPDC001309 TaxID=3364013 RepID=UPI00369053CF
MTTEAHTLIESNACPMSACLAPAGRPCLTDTGRVASHYHAARMVMVKSLERSARITIPKHRRDGAQLDTTPAAPVTTTDMVKLGYARVSTAAQDLTGQMDALADAGCTEIYDEKVSTRETERPERSRALARAADLASLGLSVRLVVHEHKRIGRGIEVMDFLRKAFAAGVEVEFLTGDHRGVFDPNSPMAMGMLTMSAIYSESEREYIREKTLIGQEVARDNGKRVGGVKVTDDDMKTTAERLYRENKTIPEIMERLVIRTGNKRGQHPSRRTVYRLLADVMNEHQADDV